MIYKDSQDGIPHVIGSSFPKQVATTFSTKWTDEFPPLNRMRLGGELSKPKTSVVIIGGSKQIYQKIIAWMMSCCDGAGLRQFETFGYDDKPFSKYHTLRRHAHDIGCKYLEDEMQRRLNRLGSQQIHSEDVRQLYLTLPRGSDDLRYLARHVAHRIFNNNLKSKSSYLTLREEIPAFDEDINAILNPMVEERKATRQAEREARAEANRQRRAENFHRRQWGDKAQDVNVDQEGTVHAKVTLSQARQGQNGRPAQYLNKKDFTRQPYRGPKSRRFPQRDDAQAVKPVQEKQDEKQEKAEEKPKDAKVESRKDSVEVKNQEKAAGKKSQKVTKQKTEKIAVKEPEKEVVKEAEAADSKPEVVLTIQPRNSSVPGTDLTNSKNKNARRRAKKRASVATTESSKDSSEAGTQERTEEKSESWADEMSKQD